VNLRHIVNIDCMITSMIFFKAKLIISSPQNFSITIKNTVFKYFRNNRTDGYCSKVSNCNRFIINTELLSLSNSTVYDCPQLAGTWLMRIVVK